MWEIPNNMHIKRYWKTNFFMPFFYLNNYAIVAQKYILKVSDGSTPQNMLSVVKKYTARHLCKPG